MEYFSGGDGGGGDRRPPRKDLQMPGPPSPPRKRKKDSYTMRIPPPYPHHPPPPQFHHPPPPQLHHPPPPDPQHPPPPSPDHSPSSSENSPPQTIIIQAAPEDFKEIVQKFTGCDPQEVTAAVIEAPGPSRSTRGGPRGGGRRETASINTTRGGYIPAAAYDVLAWNPTASFPAPIVPEFSAPARFPIPVVMGQQQQQHSMSTPTTSSGAPIPVMTWGHNTFTSDPMTTSFGAPMPPQFKGFPFAHPTAYPVAMTPFNPPTTSFAEPVSPPPPPWDPANPLYQYFQ